MDDMLVSKFQMQTRGKHIFYIETLSASNLSWLIDNIQLLMIVIKAEHSHKFVILDMVDVYESNRWKKNDLQPIWLELQWNQK